jgi:hypothetical protein
VLAGTAAGPLRAAGLVDPLLRFRQIRTEHFIIYFHQGEDALARRLAGMVEEVRAQVGASLATSPPRLTRVILADQGEVANGWATPLPRNTVFLSAAAPSGADFIGRTTDWLRLVFTHEYSHVVHLDRSGSWAWLVRGLFGRTVVAFPNLWLPQWQIEGLATWEESVLTGEGRRSAGDFRQVERVAAAAGHPVSLDRASGGLVGWPDGHAAYASGLGFQEYLVERFGQESIGRLARSTSRRFPFFGTRAYRTVYGESLGSLWRDYHEQLRASTARRASSFSPVRQLTHEGNLVLGTRFAPAACESCPPEVLYSVRNPDGFPALRSVRIDGTMNRRLTDRYLGATLGVGVDVVVFDQQEVRRNVGVYSDLFVLDRPGGRVRALTREARLQDPDLAPDARRLAAVRANRGQRDLVVVQLASGAVDAGMLSPDDVRVLLAVPDTQFSAPRWSPDGTQIAVERRRVGFMPDVLIVDAATGQTQRVIGDAAARVVTPAWRPDGQAVVAAADFDAGAFDLYEFTLSGNSEARRLTHTSGATWPDVSPDGRTLVFTGYNASGYDVYTAPYAALAAAPRDLAPAATPVVRAVSAGDRDETGYSPWGTIAPVSWTPLVFADGDQTRLGGSFGGTDLLGRHAYGANATWLIDGPAVVRPVARTAPDWSAVYAYTRWRPSVFISGSSETSYGVVTDSASSDSIAIAALQREIQAGVFVPVVHVRASTQALAALVRTHGEYRLPDGDRTTTLVSSRLAMAHDTTRRYGYSISREHGLNVGATLELARRALGSDANATTGTVDLRAYLPGWAIHHVVAARVAGGLSKGSDRARQTFRLGAVAASPSVIDFGSNALGLFRGSGPTLVGRDILTGNLEYRFPLLTIERGYGTWPLLIRTAHASVFADAGRVGGFEVEADGWARAFGAELSIDAVAGYSLPFAATVGASVSHDGAASRGASVYARLGRAF